MFSSAQHNNQPEGLNDPHQPMLDDVMQSTALPFSVKNEEGIAVTARRFSPILGREIEITRDRVEGLVYMLVLGDALGAPVEMFTRERIAEKFGRVEDFVPFAGHKYFDGMPEGTWTDDTQLTIALMDAFSEAGSLSLDAVIKTHIAALEETTRGWGNTTRDGVKRLRDGGPIDASMLPPDLNAGLGNGVAMKIMPVALAALLSGASEQEVCEFVEQVTLLTHPSSMAVSSALAHTFAAIYCLSRSPSEFSVEKFAEVAQTYSIKGEFSHVNTASGQELSRRLGQLIYHDEYDTTRIVTDFRGGKSRVEDSLPFSYMFFVKDPQSINSMFEAVNAGGDTDSNGAIVGGLLGALHGRTIIPQNLLAKVQDLDRVKLSINRFCSRFNIK